MIELREVTKRYGRKGAGAEALSGASLTIPAGAVWAVVGPNGAGKSTLLSLLLGFIRPSAGAVTLAGELPHDYLRRRGAGYLPERFTLPVRWRTGEALRMLARLERVSAAETDRAIQLLGLDPHRDKPVGELSRGLLQRLGLAQALLARRSLIVLDEPTEGLDPLWRVRLRDIIAELRMGDRTIVIASHDLSEVERIADRAVVLENGTIRDLLDVRAHDVSAEYRITLAVPCAGMAEVFPEAARVDGLDYHVRLTGATELTQRLAGLIALGGVVAAVVPLRPNLEERVRGALAGDS
ncbi:MAG: ABC transporter ATP-binding protein [Longimicrobiales bacterium]